MRASHSVSVPQPIPPTPSTRFSIPCENIPCRPWKLAQGCFSPKFWDLKYPEFDLGTERMGPWPHRHPPFRGGAQLEQGHGRILLTVVSQSGVQQRHRPRGAFEKCKLPEPIPDQLNHNSGRDLCFNKPSSDSNAPIRILGASPRPEDPDLGRLSLLRGPGTRSIRTTWQLVGNAKSDPTCCRPAEPEWTAPSDICFNIVCR